jgi:hypothetical protein
MPTDPLECFIQELLDLSTMNGDNGPDIFAVLDDLPVLQRGDVASISMQEALDVCCLTLYIISYIVCNTGCISLLRYGRGQAHKVLVAKAMEALVKRLREAHAMVQGQAKR